MSWLEYNKNVKFINVQENYQVSVQVKNIQVEKNEICIDNSVHIESGQSILKKVTNYTWTQKNI